MAHDDPIQHAPVKFGQAAVAHSTEEPWNTPPPNAQFSIVALVHVASGKQHAPAPTQAEGDEQPSSSGAKTPPAEAQAEVLSN